jgi:hypothetical protein
MSERFLIEAKNPNGIPITPPQDTRSEEGYLKDLTIEGILEMLTGGEIKLTGFSKITTDGSVGLMELSPQNFYFRLVNFIGLLDTYMFNNNINWQGINVGYSSLSSGSGTVARFDVEPFTGGRLQLGDLLGNIKIEFSGSSGNGRFDGVLTINDTTDSTSKDTGAIITEGGLGVEKSAHIGNSLHTGGLNIKGIYLLDTSINANYTVTANISYVRVDDSGAIGAGVTLPAATGTGKIITIKDVGGSASSIPISISRTGSDTIDGLTSTNIPTNYGVLRVIDGASGRWDII